jgi:formylmethanofuran dehydrogenase subunit E
MNEGLYQRCAGCGEYVGELDQDYYELDDKIYCSSCWEAKEDDSGDSPKYKQD